MAKETIVIDGVRYYADRPTSCRGCFFWKNRKAGCSLKKENCYYLAESSKKKSPCDSCYYHPEFKYRKCLFATCPYGKPEKEYFRQKPLPMDEFPCREVVIGVLDYIHSAEAEQFAFFRVPKLLIQHEAFQRISAEAKLMYSILFDRTELSNKNG
ncbi:replication initiator protein A [Lachnoclostridium sp. Marseille-P6806]|uniref:replication initiator protein A n=1 Tax=Lachnoclostridium sp. Marseille-P6806 TaxID=2364793 RepID=UPI001F5F948A|nr:replication initiator protein A [Lachnoclostridium sp. Marseille-P6806]